LITEKHYSSSFIITWPNKAGVEIQRFSLFVGLSVRDGLSLVFRSRSRIQVPQ